MALVFVFPITDHPEDDDAFIADYIDLSCMILNSRGFLRILLHSMSLYWIIVAYLGFCCSEAHVFVAHSGLLWIK